jgi:hypothetical protein
LGFEDRNPMDLVQFYGNFEDQSILSQRPYVSNNMAPSQFIEFYLRVFVKDEAKSMQAKKAVERFVKKFHII